MNVAVMRTKAEQALSEAFDKVQDKLPGGPDVVRVRRAAVERFAELGLPHRRIEAWKYTDLRNGMREALPPAVGDDTRLTIADIIVAMGPFAGLEPWRVTLVNGVVRSELSSKGLSDGLTIKSLAAALSAGDGADAAALASLDAHHDDATIALNTAYMTDGAVVELAPGVRLDRPLLLIHVRAGTEGRFTAIRHRIDIGAGAEAAIVEAYVDLPGAGGEGQINAATAVSVGDGAKVTHVKATVDQGAIVHLGNWIVTLGAASAYRGFQLTSGVGLARQQIFATFAGEDASLDLSGAILARGSEHVDTTLVVDHAVPSCTSRELFKAVLDGEARGVFQGKIVVRQIAQKTDGKQMSQAMMLSPAAEFNSKPELEIFADDVACGHGATAAEIDQDHLFYCRSRGIPEPQARLLLVEAFIGEAIEKLGHEALEEALKSYARVWLLGHG
ncbi:MAG: Fe-S cluster assembly protein SufD [Hyphomicrobiaceae bacterium]|nr:Fe-S cluster assembly protein SufD [Hyphomicrobiaceae bacterium]